MRTPISGGKAAPSFDLMVMLRVVAAVPPSGTVHMTVPLIRPPETVGPNPVHSPHNSLLVQGSGFRVQSSFRVQGAGLRVEG